MPTSTPDIAERLSTIEAQNTQQLDMIREMRLALVGDGALGITGVVATAKSAHKRLDEAERARGETERQHAERMDRIERAADRERWQGRIGAGVVGATVAAIGLWLKSFFTGK